MVKKSLIIGSLVLLTGCVERGSLVNVKTTQGRGTSQVQIQGQDKSIPTLVVRSTREDEVQKNISATLILAIGLVLIL